MKRSVVAAIALLLLFPGATLAAPVGTCHVTPQAAPAGTDFVAVCSGWGRGEAIHISWLVEDIPDTLTVLYSNGYDLTADGSGTFTTDQVLPVAGRGVFFAEGPQNYKTYWKTGPVGSRTILSVE